VDKVRQHETQITVCGLVCNVEVTYEVHDWGSLSRAPEVSCGTVVDLDTGRDWTRYCNETRPVVKIQAVDDWWFQTKDPMQRAIFGYIVPAYSPAWAYRFEHSPTMLVQYGPTVMDALHNEVCDAVDEIARQDVEGSW